MIKWILIVYFCLLTICGNSQQLAAFHDFRQHFMLFDNGKVRELDYLPAQSFQVGGCCIPFVSNAGQFKVYYHGEIINLADQFVSKYYATSYLLVYFLYDQMYVFDNGRSKLLSGNVKNYAIGDSMVAFVNENTHSSHIYYKGEIFELERSLVGSPLLAFKAGDNLFAYFNDNSKYLKAFYHGKIWFILQTASAFDYQAGRNLLTYVDKARNSFHVFYKGQIIDLEDYEPKSYQTGDDLMAYIDNLGTFKAFYEGSVQEISTFEPDFYEIKDSLLVFAELGYLKVFYKGNVHDLGKFVPGEYQLQESTLAYIGQNGWLQAFTNGNFIKVTSDLIGSYSVNYNIISMKTTVNKINIFYKGEIYETD